MKLVTLVAVLAVLGAVQATLDPKIVDGNAAMRVVDTYKDSTLYEMPVDGYSRSAPQLLVLNGDTYHDVGFAYGRLMGKAAVKNMESLYNSLTDGKKVYNFLIDMFLDWQYNMYLSKQLPAEYKEELAGALAGGQSVGVDNLDVVMQRGLTLANFPGDIKGNIEYLLLAELEDRAAVREWMLRLEFLTESTFAKRGGMQCSMFGIWGSRVRDAPLYTARNLDWNPNTGINEHKLITVYNVAGKLGSATVGFAGLPGALAGMSQGGLTVHEAENDSKKETFTGMPWIMRLRHVMENAHDLAEADKMWVDSDNSMGINHGIGSAVDATRKGSAGFHAYETMAGYTAKFADNDARENTYVDASGAHMGHATPELVVRTNHGYDATIREQEYTPPKNAQEESVYRYFLAVNAFEAMRTRGELVGAEQAVNVTALLGQKGHDFFTCPTSAEGINVMSITFAPAPNAGTIYAAWESGQDAGWRPAACSPFVKLDMAKLWRPTSSLAAAGALQE